MKLQIYIATLLASLGSARVVARQESSDLSSDEWIVTVSNDASVADILAEVNSLHRSAEPLAPEKTYEFDGFRGLTIKTSEAVLQSLQSQGLVNKYERNAEMWLNQAPIVTQSNAPYNLARISSRVPGTTEYKYRESPGKGTFIYILDSGININHVDFEGRAYHGANFSRDLTPEDRDGHGTSVAGLAGGRQWGVAKEATLINVKVTDGLAGTMSDILSGFEWTANDAKAKSRIGRAVANLSIGLPRSEIVNDAVTAMAEAGVFVVVAAGNNNQDANDYSPGTAEGVCNIASSNSTDGRSFFSNWGTGIDLFAPGGAVESPSHTSNTGTRVTSGSSEAAPQVAGLGAYLISVEGPAIGNALCDRMKELATRDVIVDPRGSPNLLIYNGIA
ncbi:Putative peptidase S8/S53 domain, peptidase S8, subtilisin, His-active [Septoria linicola]|uniref:Peptidase S8/S53 domain, peptidase S8, subtilisin, His-active n=1 Tax=Septoria linicola TaxID=215465 RepID=A0A9Q9AP84_9PEZI|nr:Putative peptidase S8/S53 domain, peptidase S8, subtilisin, His-active [Septoria linicola]